MDAIFKINVRRAERICKSVARRASRCGDLAAHFVKKAVVLRSSF
jgi:hypothetical protein